MDGLLLIDKPKKWTSFDVVAKVRGIIRAEARQQGLERKVKVGHTGTLDPLATGLLVLAIGSYTKKVPELTRHDKTYEAVITLGKNSTTDDAEGDMEFISAQKPSQKAMEAALESFIGTSQQMPPQFSAIKVGGVKAYDAARRGQAIELKPRQVHIYSINNVMYDYPTVSFTIEVASGTYIRSLARDLGKKLGTGAYLSDLRRTTVGDFRIEKAISTEDLSYETIQKALLLL